MRINLSKFESGDVQTWSSPKLGVLEILFDNSPGTWRAQKQETCEKMRMQRWQMMILSLPMLEQAIHFPTIVCSHWFSSRSFQDFADLSSVCTWQSESFAFVMCADACATSPHVRSGVTTPSSCWISQRPRASPSSTRWRSLKKMDMKNSVSWCEKHRRSLRMHVSKQKL